MTRHPLLAALALPALLAIGAGPALADDKDDDDDVEVKLSEVPAAVQETFKKEAQGNKIERVTKDVDDGKTTYEAEVTIDGTKYDIEVDESGKLIEKDKSDDDDDDDKDGANKKKQ